MPEQFSRWTNKDEIAALMDVSTAACTECKGPARVPEDVVAVHQVDDVLRPVVVCPECVPIWLALMKEEIDVIGEAIAEYLRARERYYEHSGYPKIKLEFDDAAQDLYEAFSNFRPILEREDDDEDESP